jgi:hypothetical protein
VAVAVFPAASLAIAVRVWVPLATALESQVVLYGEEVSSAPSSLVEAVPSR